MLTDSILDLNAECRENGEIVKNKEQEKEDSHFYF